VFSSLYNTAAGLAVLATCTADVRQWYLQNGLQLNPEISLRHCESAVCCRLIRIISIRCWCGSSGGWGHEGAGCRPRSVSGVFMVARSCKYHVQAISHIRHLLMAELAQTLACSLILSKIYYCNTVLHGTPTGTIQKLQLVQNNALCSMHRGNPMPSYYCTSCIGCQSSSGSHTSWQFWRTKFRARPLWFTYTTKSQNMPAVELYIHLPSCAGLDIGLASQPGCGRVRLHSVEPFHYKLLPWSWLKWHWCADWLLWRSLLMCRLIFLPFQWGTEYWIATHNGRQLYTLVPFHAPTASDAAGRVDGPLA